MNPGRARICRAAGNTLRVHVTMLARWRETGGLLLLRAGKGRVRLKDTAAILD